MNALARRPFARLSRPNRRRALWALAAAVLVQLGPLLLLERRMKRTGGPGIIPFELAGSQESAQRIMKAWGSEGRRAAKRGLVLDYPFPATYAPLHALACTAAADALGDRGRTGLAAVGSPLAWGQLAAAGFDYVENSALLLVLSGRHGRLPRLARRAALVKFALLSAGWGYMLLGLVAGGRPRGGMEAQPAYAAIGRGYRGSAPRSAPG